MSTCEKCGEFIQKSCLCTEPLESFSILEGYAVMPKSLTAENGAKNLLIGEFCESIEITCPECADDPEPFEGCEVCDGEGVYTQKIYVEWTTIKEIYAMAVKHLEAKQ